MAELKKVLSYKVLVLIVIVSIMGTGIFFLPALGAEKAGAASLISWTIMAIFAIYISMCFGELCSMFPSAGGVYEFCKHAYGRPVSFLVGWLVLIGGNITIAMLIIGAISYLLPPMPNFKLIIMLISALLLLVFNIIAYRGMKASAIMLVTFSFITLGTIFGLIIPSLFSLKASNFVPFFNYKASMVFVAIFFIAETFFGWESPTFLAGETKDGERIVPKALVHGTIIICLISLIFVFCSIGTLGWHNLGSSSAPLSDFGAALFGNTGRYIFTLLAYLAIIGSVAAWVVSAPRLILSMADDKLFLTQFNKIHPKFQTPHRAIVFQCIISILFVFIGLGSYRTLLHLLVPILLIMYSFVMLAVVVLRYKKPGLRRFYKVPFGKIGPIIVMIFFVLLLGAWLYLTEDALHILFLGFTLLLTGVPVYFLLEMYYNPRAVRIIDDLLAYLTLLTERIALPIKVRKEIVSLVGNIKGKTVLEFGCSVGTLTMQLAEEVGPAGRIYATDISKRNVMIAQQRAKKRGHRHVFILHDFQHSTRLHPDVPNIHTIVSVGSLGYLQDVEKVLRDMNKRLRKGSKICFVDYDKLFDIIPNVEWLTSDQQVKDIFHRCGFRVSVIRKQGFAWKYIFIYGIKEK